MTPITVATLSDLATASTRPDQPRTTLDAAAAICARAYATHLFTVLRFDSDAGEIERIYSSDPAKFVTGFRKLMGPTEFGQQVLRQGQPWFGDAAAIEATFPDGKIVTGQGYVNSICQPIGCDGRTVGILSLASRDPDLRADSFAGIEVIAAMLVPACTQAD